MGLGALVIYGVGDMLGAGIYAVLGKYAGEMGNAIWLAFAVSMIASMLTGLSYANLGSRYPKAAGSAYISYRAFNWPLLTYVIGLVTIASGLTSFATQSRAFAGYVLGYLGLALPTAKDPTLPLAAPWMVFGIAVAFILFLAAINFRGMRESTVMNAVCTAIEVGGLLFVVAVGLKFWGGVNLLEIPAANSTPENPTSTTLGTLSLFGLAGFALQGAVLTLYAFIGFEDMINVSEEVKDPQKTFPRGVILALIITGIVYAAISITAVSVVPWQQLSQSNQPMVDVVAKAAPWFPPALFTLVSVFAIANTALLNYIMGSRLVYGLAKQGFLPAKLGAVHPTRRTPHVSIFVLMLVVIALALAGDISSLAGATSLLLLFTFLVVNASLVILKLRKDEPKGAFEIPIAVPALGFLVCFTLIIAALSDPARLESLKIGGVVVAIVTALYFLVRPKIDEEAAREL